MTDEDRTAAKLKGYNCLVKFRDGEELLLEVPELGTEDGTAEWFTTVEDFLNDREQIFPHASIALARDAIKYIKEL